jgi:hypothetical protein
LSKKRNRSLPRAVLLCCKKPRFFADVLIGGVKGVEVIVFMVLKGNFYREKTTANLIFE